MYYTNHEHKIFYRCNYTNYVLTIVTIVSSSQGPLADKH